MKLQDIISSGLLELYAAGIATEEEMLEVEEGIAQYPEVAAELKAISSGMEAYVNAYAIVPAAGVKEKIFSQINTVENGKRNTVGKSQVPGAKVIDINTFWKLTAAASVVLLIASIGLNIITYYKYSEADKNLLVATQTLGGLEEKNKIMEAGMNVVQSKYSVPVSLKGQQAAPGAAAKIFWMQNTGEVFIDPSNLPEAPEGKQYQLWAFVDGKPVDGGMILTSTKGDKYRIQKMKSFGKVEAFAVTLETEKGNQSPKGPIYVMGNM
ncbi:MAG: anti-sigma factor [Ferruginibacter sp.]